MIVLTVRRTYNIYSNNNKVNVHPVNCTLYTEQYYRNILSITQYALILIGKVNFSYEKITNNNKLNNNLIIRRLHSVFTGLVMLS